MQMYSVLIDMLAVRCMSQEAVHFELIEQSQKLKQKQTNKKHKYNITMKLAMWPWNLQAVKICPLS